MRRRETAPALDADGDPATRDEAAVIEIDFDGAVARVAAFAPPRAPDGLKGSERAALEAWDPSDHAIDRKLARQLAGGLERGELARHLVTADLAWDRELNRAYRDLRSSLSGEARAAIRDEQRDWLENRDKDHGLVGSIYGRSREPDPVRVLRRLQHTRARAQELGGQVD